MNAAAAIKTNTGEPVTVVKSYGEFILVRTPDGRSGWLSEKEIGCVFASRCGMEKQGEI